jgi:EAL domain-containing protein (putative c-di-GMP-specific phosphodiesterase class I)
VGARRGTQGLYLAAQPIVRASDGSLYGRELLLRSRSPRLPDPGAVLEAAERLGRVRDVGRVVRRMAAAVAVPAGTSLFVNVHSLELEDDELHSPETPLAGAASAVVLEVTERGRIDAVSDLTPRIARLRGLGYRIAVDDFGAGYAALNSFASLRPDVAKIDMALVRASTATSRRARGLGWRDVPRPRDPGRRRGHRDRGRARDAHRARLRPAAGLPDRHAAGCFG